MPTEKEKKQHLVVMKKVLLALKPLDGIVFKWGSCLLFCYGLNRFSEDLDFDAVKRADPTKLITDFCSANKYSLRVGKTTPTVRKFFIHYGGYKPLKLEFSYRSVRDGVRKPDSKCPVCYYTICELAYMKSVALGKRAKCRDLFDIHFIVKKYGNKLGNNTLSTVKDALAYSGYERLALDFKTSKKEDSILSNIDDDSLVLDLFEWLKLDLDWQTLI